MKMKSLFIQSFKDEISPLEWFDSAHDESRNINVHDETRNFEHFDLQNFKANTMMSRFLFAQL